MAVKMEKVVHWYCNCGLGSVSTAAATAAVPDVTGPATAAAAAVYPADWL